MKLFSRITNSYVMTAALLAVIVGSLCFSVGEGMRLRPFPNPKLSQIENSNSLKEAGESNLFSLSKYGPLDVPAQHQKRGKRQPVEVAAGAFTHTQLAFTSIVRHFQFEVDGAKRLPFIGPHSGRAPPLNT
jgi:hypothetical protein